MICTSHPFHRMRRLTLSLFLALVPAVPHALAQADARVTKLAAGAIQTQANDRIERRPDAHLPLFVEFDGSSALTKGMASALEAQGIRTTQDRSAAPATLSIRGDLVLMGGLVFYKGAKVPMGEATERTLAAASTNRTTTAGEAANTAATVALEVASLKAATTPFWSGLAVSRMADVLGEATGIKGAFNTALTGDPRRICLSRCEVVAEALTKAMGSITLQPATAKPQ